MQKHSELIVLSRPSERAENLIFLFRLSNFKVTHITESNEALNFLLQRQKSPCPAKLLVIINAEQHLQFLEMLNEQDHRGASLPILLLYDKNPLQLGQLKCKPELKNLLQQCRIDESHSFIREMLLAPR